MASANWYGQALLGQYSATAARRVDWVTDTIKCTLHTATYTPNQDTHVFFSDATNELTTGGGYTAGGVTLGTKSTSYDATTNETRLIAANAVWTSATFTVRYALIWKDTGSAATSPLLGYIDLGAQTITSGTFTVAFDAVSGVLKITAA
jgi:hypothetical protein